ncbi:hypothetical protein GcM1_c14296o27 [Golovinomyces cichoracearum]|uniref:Uncharacterized protein n=1 Tax=Golovinomyces cichoracearum TaxID=62708 RepID=A0A420IVI9_9PEZI|nr:hypothetical protein GcM1_c14296o27 [Golovinomyces cichoracearum]
MFYFTGLLLFLCHKFVEYRRQYYSVATQCILSYEIPNKSQI